MAVPNGPHGSINRLVSDLGPEHYKTYQMSTPLGTHWRKATCEEVQCNMWVYGGVLTVDLSTELGQRQYHYATHDRMRSHSMQRVTQTLVKFVYGPGTICFEPVRSSHRIKMDRLPFYLVSGGDWRGNPRGTPRTIHRRPEDWVDDFATHQDKLAETAKRG
jgi:hypothetical protein